MSSSIVRQWPLPKGSYRISSRFAGRMNPVTGAPENHSGTDMACPDGTPFYAPADGTIQYLGAANGYGQWLVLDHPASVGGGCSEFGHMWKTLPGLRVGQKVMRGQLIGHVGSNGQSTGPHLHMTVWEFGYGGRRIDPETWLDGCPHVPVGGGKATAVTAPSPAGGSPVTDTHTWVIDISSHQNGLPLKLAAAQGYAAVFIKATEGHTYLDPVFHSHLADARDNNMLVAAYLYVWHNSTPEQMADAFAKHVGDTSVPCILDIEANAGYDPAHWLATVKAVEARGYRVPMVYIPRWYWDEAGSPDLSKLPPLWSSAYPAGKGEAGSVLYFRAGGDAGSGWKGYGGNQVVLWQFTDGADLGGGWQVDASAYKGPRVMLEQLLTGGRVAAEKPATTVPVKKITDTERLVLVLDQLVGPGKDLTGTPDWTGWDQLDGLTIVDALADTRRVLQEVLVEVKALQGK